MAKIVLDNVASGYNLNKINENFTKIAAALNDLVFYRENPEGETNTVKQDMDMDGNSILNVDDLRVMGTLTANGVNIDEINSALVWRGAWDNLFPYAESDAVSYNGSSYICIEPHTGELPTNIIYWDLLAQQGTSGSGSGDVNGPASSTTGNIVVFANGTGKDIDDGAIPVSTLLVDGDVGVVVQPYDADIAKTDVVQNFSVPQRSGVLTDNDLSFDLGAKQNFGSTPTAGGVLTFTSIPDGQSGYIILINGSNYAITAHTNTKISATDLATISATGTYRLDYATYGGNVYVTTTGAFT